MLLYVHVPFCRRKCHYCAFHSVVPARGDMARYADLVAREAGHWGRKLGRPNVSTIHFGGGTPSLLPPAQLDRVVRALRNNFALAPDVEFSFEANPDSLADWTYVEVLRALGVTRLSVGVQSFNDQDLARLGRPHTAEQAEGAVHLARSAGFANLNIDLIWGLPGQKLHHWIANLKRAVRLEPTHMSCYGLSIEPGTHFERLDEQLDLELPDEAEQQKMYLYGADFLESVGYLQYEISNFARMGYQSRHNVGYWEGKRYLGLGPAAVSTLGSRRWTNPAALDDYAAAVERGAMDEDAETLDRATRVREMVMLRLRTTRGLRLSAYRKITGRSLTKEHGAMLQALRQNELIRISGGYLRLSRMGMLISDTIIGNLFPDDDAPAP